MTRSTHRNRPAIPVMVMAGLLAAVGLWHVPATASEDAPSEPITDVEARVEPTAVIEPESATDVESGAAETTESDLAAAPAPTAEPEPTTDDLADSAPRAATDDTDAGPLDIDVSVSSDRDRLHVRATVRDDDGVVDGLTVNGSLPQPWGIGFRLTAVGEGVYEWTSSPYRPGDYDVTVRASRDGVTHEGVGRGRIVGTDATPPAVSVTAPEPNIHGWFTDPVTVTMTAADPQGVAWIRYAGHPTVGSIRTISGDRHELRVDSDGTYPLRVDAQDTYGNRSPSHDLDVLVDTTAPTAAAAGTLLRGTATQGESASAELECADETSGIRHCYAFFAGHGHIRHGEPLPTSTAGSLPYELVAVDRAGLVTTVAGTLQVSADDIPPVLTVQTDPIASNARGWFLRDVKVTITASDGGSGPAWIEHDGDGTLRRHHHSSSSFDVREDGVHTFTYRGQDVAGNTTGWRERVVRLDREGPSIDVAAPIDGSTVVVGNELTADFGCEDATSGLVSCEASVSDLPIADGESLPTDTLGEYELTVRADDVAGHSTTRTVQYRVVESDLSATITADSQPNAAGWWRDDVTVTISAPTAPSSSSVHWELEGAQRGDGSSPGSGEVTVRSEGRTVVRYWVQTQQGGRSEPMTYEVQVDRSLPRIDVGLDDGAVLTAGEEVTWSFDCDDSIAGIESCESDLADGAAVPTEVIGDHVVETRAVDAAGNATMLRTTYRVMTEAPTPRGDGVEDPGGSLPSAGLNVGAQVVVLAAVLVAGGVTFLWDGRRRSRDGHGGGS